MSATTVAQDVACDIALLEHTSRLQSMAPSSMSRPSKIDADGPSVYVHDVLGYFKPDKGSQVLSDSSTSEVLMNVTSANISMNVSGVLQQSSRKLKSKKATSPAKKKTSLTTDNSKKTSESSTQHPKNTPGPLPPISSILLPHPAQPLAEKITLVYVTTESDEAGAAIVSALKALHPHVKIVSTVDDLSTVKFTHTYKNIGKEERLKPVSLAFVTSLNRNSLLTYCFSAHTCHTLRSRFWIGIFLDYLTSLQLVGLAIPVPLLDDEPGSLGARLITCILLTILPQFKKQHLAQGITFSLGTGQAAMSLKQQVEDGLAKMQAGYDE